MFRAAATPAAAATAARGGLHFAAPLFTRQTAMKMMLRTATTIMMMTIRFMMVAIPGLEEQTMHL